MISDKQTIEILDSEDKRIGAANPFRATSLKLTSAPYKVIIRYRHERLDLLEKLRNHSLSCEMKLPKEIPLKCYTNEQDVYSDVRSLRNISLSVGGRAVVYVGGVLEELSKTSLLGDVYVGSLTLKQSLFISFFFLLSPFSFLLFYSCFLFPLNLSLLYYISQHNNIHFTTQ
jgi:hypothetical protein